MNCPTCGCTYYDGCPDKYCSCDNPIFAVIQNRNRDDSNLLHKPLPLRACVRCNKWEGPLVLVHRSEYDAKYDEFWEENEE